LIIGLYNPTMFCQIKKIDFSLTTATLAKSVGLGKTSHSPSLLDASGRREYDYAWGDCREFRCR